jgi:hypothetical protein
MVIGRSRVLTDSIPRLIFDVMSEVQNTENGRRFIKTGFVVAISFVAAAAAVALFVVVRNVRKVAVGPVPEALRPLAADTGAAAFHSAMSRKLRNLDRRCSLKVQQLAGRMTPGQDSLLGLARSGLKDVWARLGRYDSIPAAVRRPVAESIRIEYEIVKRDVNAFTRSDMGVMIPSDDSLDREVQKLIDYK